MFAPDDFITAENISVLRVKAVPGRFDVKPRAVDALAFRISGEAEFICCGERIFSHPGDIFFLPKNTPYTVNYTEGEIIVFHFCAGGEYAGAKNFGGAFDEEIYGIFVKAELVWKEKNPGYRYLCASLLYEILPYLCVTKPHTVMPENFISAVSEINNRFSDGDLCIAGVCRKYNISETYFRRLFRRHYGKTPVEYLTELRLEYAENLLMSFYTVEAAANASGFSDPKYFARVVRKKYGLTPSELRTRGLGGQIAQIGGGSDVKNSGILPKI